MSEMNGLPLGWIATTIGQIADTRTGGTPSRSRLEFFGGDIPWVKSGELRDGIVFSTEEKLTAIGLEHSSAKIFPKGTLCIALYGATVGKLGILGIDAATNQAICGIFLPPQICTKYVRYFLEFKRPNLISQGKGGAQPNISNGIVRSTKIPVPPPSEQNRIVAKIEELFSDLDAGVAALERVRANLKRYRAAVLKAAVEGRLTEKWRQANPPAESASKLLERILTDRRDKWEQAQLAKYAAVGKQPPKKWREKYQEPVAPAVTNLPELPPGWCWATIDQLISYLRNGWPLKPDPSPPGHRILRINAVRPMSLDFNEFRFVNRPKDEVATYFIESGDLLFTRYNGSVELLGVSAMVRDISAPSLHPDKLIRIKTVLGQPLPAFLEISTNIGVSRRHMHRRARTTAGQTGISGADIREMPVPLCPISEQDQIITEVGRRLSVADALATQLDMDLKRSMRLRQSILKCAFGGKLVRQEPDDMISVQIDRGE